MRTVCSLCISDDTSEDEICAEAARGSLVHDEFREFGELHAVLQPRVIKAISRIAGMRETINLFIAVGLQANLTLAIERG